MINRRNAMIKRKTGIAGKITKKLTITIIGGLAGAILAGTMPQQVQNFAQNDRNRQQLPHGGERSIRNSVSLRSLRKIKTRKMT